MQSILILENDLGVANLIGLILKDYKTLSAQSIEEAREAAAGETPIDLLIADVSLSPGSGIDFAIELRKTRNIPVLLISGYKRNALPPEHQARLNQLDAGAVRFLAKPFTVSELTDAVHSLIGEPAA